MLNGCPVIFRFCCGMTNPMTRPHLSSRWVLLNEVELVADLGRTTALGLTIGLTIFNLWIMGMIMDDNGWYIYIYKYKYIYIYIYIYIEIWYDRWGKRTERNGKTWKESANLRHLWGVSEHNYDVGLSILPQLFQPFQAWQLYRFSNRFVHIVCGSTCLTWRARFQFCLSIWSLFWDLWCGCNRTKAGKIW